MATDPVTDPPDAAPSAPPGAPVVLVTLILVATVANLNLAVANVALPDIGRAFDASQTALNLVAVGFSLGLAASVLYLGAIGDRYGRKLLLVVGVVLSIPASALAAWAPSVEVLTVARLLGGLAAGMAYPTTLALITALWRGPSRTTAIALWSAVGGAMAAFGPLVAGFLLGSFWWGSVFVVTIPLAVLALVLALTRIPAHVNETTDAVDHLGGVLSVLAIAAVVLAINFAPVSGASTLALGLGAGGIVLLAGFVVRQRVAANPLYDLHVAGRPTFWVAAVGGIIVFGSLMGAMFVGQQFLQNVLGYSSVEAGLSILPGAAMMVVVAPRSARLVESIGSRATLLIGYLCSLAGFLVMLVLWGEGAAGWTVWLAFALVGAGVGFAGTPASRSLTSSVPVRRAGMASGTADLQRDLGGAIMQSILGALLTAGYATAFSRTIAASPEAASVSDDVQQELLKSYSSASATAARYPSYSTEILEAAREAFVTGQRWAYLAGVIAIVVGMGIVFVGYPRRDDERGLLASYAEGDARPTTPREP